jgi:dinuclear metal center YbgI/SA1388 family protein
MLVEKIVTFLESIAPISLQENYDNAGLITGNTQMNCTGVLISLDCVESTIEEAIEKKCNLIVAHHPIIFVGLKKINGNDYVERTIIKAIKNDIAIYAIHTNLDNVLRGVNGKIASLLGLENIQILAPKKNTLQKLIVYTPTENVQQLTEALFAAGAGNIGNYSECAYTSTGTGYFKPELGSTPKVGEIGKRESVQETKLEVIFPTESFSKVVKAVKANHPYEEVAHELYNLENYNQETGSGIIGNIPKTIAEDAFLGLLTIIFKTKVIRHSRFTGKTLKKIAICGGAGSFLTKTAKSMGADVFVTSDIKYHEFFDADGDILLADIGHFESEQYTIDLLFDLLSDKFPNFALLKTSINTNPIEYFVL